MAYINRILEKNIKNAIKEYSCILLIGPRQVGKTTILKNILGDKVNFVTLDDLIERKLAMTDPVMFLNMHKTPLVIDEVQYAPELFSYIKMNIDNGRAPGSYFLTVSQSFKMMRLAKESLAGRCAIIHMTSLSQSEVYNIDNEINDVDYNAFSLDLDNLNDKIDKVINATSIDIYDRIYKGQMPGILSGKYTNINLYYSSYIETYIERDVLEEDSNIDKMVFVDFIRALACRTSQILNVHDIAKDVGISDVKAKEWILLLEKSEIIYLLHPYSNNLLKRTISSPKVYFFDTGLVCYLTRYSSGEILMNSAICGAILENYVVNEVKKTFTNNLLEPLIYYYRDKDSKEIDLLLIHDGEINPIEIKKTMNPGSELTKVFKILDKIELKRGKGAIICLNENLSAIDSNNYIIPVRLI